MLTRLWGVLSNSVFERMFSAQRNKIDLFDAMNSGKIILINTAKDLLKTEGCSIFGRFFIALIAQAALSRSILPVEKRTPFFVYIDEAHDYFDERMEDIANQARKYNVGMILAHQNLDQLGTKLRASIMSSTSIKLAGGVSAKDALILAQNMHTKSEVILAAKKQARETQFACYVRNVTSQPVMLSVPFGVMERMDEQSDDDLKQFIDANRQRVSGGDDESSSNIDSDGEIPETVVPEQANKKSPKGKGGVRHTEIQKQLYDTAIASGQGATIEEHIGEGSHIDLVVANGAEKTACEISVSTSVAHEVKNLEKCVAAGYTNILLVSDDTAHIVAFGEALKKKNIDGVSVQVLDVAEAENYIASLASNQPESVRGKKVSTTWIEISADGQERKEIVVAKALKA